MPRGQGSVNQHRKNPIMEDHPNLPNIIQAFINDRVMVKDIPDELKKMDIHISLRSVQAIMKKYDVNTVRKSGLSAIDKGIAIIQLTEDDPLGRWGTRLCQEKLSAQGIHISRDFLMEFRRLEDPEGAAARHPQTRKIHHSGLWSIGPNEEWCIDGHEKILQSMGIAVWGIVDKYSRLELGLLALPNARLSDIPPILMLRVIHGLGGMPLTITMDKGTELGKLIPFLTTLRAKYQPYLDEAILPTCKAVKSVQNITRERAWRPLWEKELGNIAHFYKSRTMDIGFHPNNDIHNAIALWLWGKIVQLRLDEYCKENRNHKVRKQKKSLLPTGGRRIDFYSSPEKYNGEDQLIAIPREDIQTLLDEYDQPDLLQFGTQEMVDLCDTLYKDIGSPMPYPKDGWAIFKLLIERYNSLM